MHSTVIAGGTSQMSTLRQATPIINKPASEFRSEQDTELKRVTTYGKPREPES
jgi:hypothetical protein